MKHIKHTKPEKTLEVARGLGKGMRCPSELQKHVGRMKVTATQAVVRASEIHAINWFILLEFCLDLENIFKNNAKGWCVAQSSCLPRAVLASFMSSPHKLESFGKRKIQLRSHTRKVGLWA